jgi:hypothetical protein
MKTSTPAVNMRVYVVWAIANDYQSNDNYIVGVYTNLSTADEVAEAERLYVNGSHMVDIEEIEVNRVNALKYENYINHYYQTQR